MIYHAVAQNTPEWHSLRLGIACSSEFHKLITAKTMKVSTQAETYMYRLLAEWMTGEQVENYESEYMVRGHELEDRAILAYEMLTDQETKAGGFITSDDKLSGCSPDRLVGENGDLEIKCPLVQTQIRYALTGTIEDDYRAQLQGRLMIHEREWVDVFSYHPRLSIPALRVYRDEDFIKALSLVLGTFKEIMLQKRAELETRFGPFQRPEAPPDHSSDFLTAEEEETLVRSRFPELAK